MKISISDWRGRVMSGAPQRTGLAYGTPAYMPPEQLTGQDVDARTDVFASGRGVELATGAHPFGCQRRGDAAHMTDLLKDVP